MKSLLSVQGVPGSPGSRGPPVSNVHVVEDSVVNSIRVIWKMFSDLLFQNLLFVHFRGKEVDLWLDRKEMRYNHAPFLLPESAAREQPVARGDSAVQKSHLITRLGQSSVWLIYLLFSFHYKLYKLYFTIDITAVIEHQYCSSLCGPQGDQGLQGPPGPFEYVDPPEDLYIKGDKVGGASLCYSLSDGTFKGTSCFLLNFK